VEIGALTGGEIMDEFNITTEERVCTCMLPLIKLIGAE